MAPPATQPTTIPAIAPPLRPELEESDEPALPVDVGECVVEVEAEVAVSREYNISIHDPSSVFVAWDTYRTKSLSFSLSRSL
jgi:hypothetical protein